MPAPTANGEQIETAWNGTAQNITSGAFTPPAGALLVAQGAAANQASASATPSFTSTPALTWTLGARLFSTVTTYCPVINSTAPGATAVSTTVTLNEAAANANDKGFDVLAFTNHGGAGAAVASTGLQTNNATISITTTQANSAICLLLADFSANALLSGRTWSGPAGFVETVAQTIPGQYTTYAGYYPDAGAAGAKTVGMLTSLGGAASGGWTLCAVEVKGTAGAPVVTSLRRQIVPIMRASGW